MPAPIASCHDPLFVNGDCDGSERLKALRLELSDCFSGHSASSVASATTASSYCGCRGASATSPHRNWQFPNEKQKIAALKLLKEMNVTNIKVRVVMP